MLAAKLDRAGKIFKYEGHIVFAEDCVRRNRSWKIIANTPGKETISTNFTVASIHAGMQSKW